MRMTHRTTCLFILFFVASIGFGCQRGPGVDISKVRGTAMLDGKPLKGAHIYFRAKGGRPSVAEVDDKGNYEAIFTAGIEGVQVGPCIVSIAWPTGVSGPAIPAEYAEMEYEIKQGKNEFNFELNSN